MSWRCDLCWGTWYFLVCSWDGSRIWFWCLDFKCFGLILFFFVNSIPYNEILIFNEIFTLVSRVLLALEPCSSFCFINIVRMSRYIYGACFSHAKSSFYFYTLGQIGGVHQWWRNICCKHESPFCFAL